MPFFWPGEFWLETSLVSGVLVTTQRDLRFLVQGSASEIWGASAMYFSILCTHPPTHTSHGVEPYLDYGTLDFFSHEFIRKEAMKIATVKECHAD
jgi:hypothetical protein